MFVCHMHYYVYESYMIFIIIMISYHRIYVCVIFNLKHIYSLCDVCIYYACIFVFILLTIYFTFKIYKIIILCVLYDVHKKKYLLFLLYQACFTTHNNNKNNAEKNANNPNTAMTVLNKTLVESMFLSSFFVLIPPARLSFLPKYFCFLPLSRLF